jgi:DNA-binding transcriptional LysR family regulator
MTAAAQAEGISLPTLSHELSEIEARLGAPLLDRSRRTVVLNEAGRFLAAQATEILDRQRRWLPRRRTRRTRGQGSGSESRGNQGSAGRLAGDDGVGRF